MRNISDTIRELAQKKKISLEKLAVTAGMTNPTLHSILNKNDAKISQLESIAAVLNVSPVIFFDESATNPIINQVTGINHGSIKQQVQLSSLSDCRRELEKALMEIEYLKQATAAKDEMIAILRERK